MNLIRINQIKLIEKLITQIVIYFLLTKIAMFKFTQIGVSKGAIVDQMDNNNPHIIAKSIQGDLQILIQTTTGMMLFMMKDFQYGINPNDQIIYDDRHPNFKLMLCLDGNAQNTWILKINDKPELIYNLINERCRLIHTRASRMIVQNINKEMKNIPNYPYLQQPQRLQYEQQYQPQNQKSSQSSLLEASKTLAQGLAKAGMLISKGLQHFASLLSKRITPSETINVSPITKAIIEKSVGASKNFLEFGTQKFANVFRIAVKQAIKLEKKIQETETGKKLKQKGTIDSAKNKLRIGLEAITNVYDGYMNGYEQAANGLSNGANQVISAKYGNDAGDAALKLVQGYKNVNKIPKIINEALKITLKQAVRENVKKENDMK